MRSVFSLLTAALVLPLLLVTGGCKPKSQVVVADGADAQALQAAQLLPDGTNVLSALDQKDYEGAVSALAKIQQSGLEGEARFQLGILLNHVKLKLMDVASSDPKAEEALKALRFLVSGR